MQFDSVVGQKELKDHLINIVDSGRISHALMFAGKEGTGNLAMALAFANYILCKTSPNRKSCELKTQSFTHPDLHFCYPVNTTRRVKGPKILSKEFIAEWREAIINNPYLTITEWMEHLGIETKSGLINVYQSAEIVSDLRLKPYESEFKIMLIWLPERMSNSAANKLLKILEEPPKKTVFLLVSQNPEQLLPTIISRVQKVLVKPITNDDMTQALVKRHHLSPDKATAIARIAQGNYREAQRLINDNEVRAFNQEMFIKWMRLLWQKQFLELMQWSETMAKTGREQLSQFFSYGLHIFRESLIINTGTPNIQMTGGSEAEFVKKFSPYVNRSNALDMIELFDEAIIHIQRNANAKLLIIDISLKMMKLVRKKTL